jgi:hypothetical protein
MVAIVVTLGGYFAGLHWLISPPDPWQANARMQTTGSAHPVAARKRAPAVRPAETISIAADIAKEPDARISTAETQVAAATTGSEMTSPAEPATVPHPSLQPAAAPSTQPAAIPSTVARRAEQKAPARESARPAPRQETKPKAIHRRLAERSSGRSLQLMVLRTYQRPDGTRFSRLLPWSEARSVMAFQSEW